MFSSAKLFRGDISTWDVSNVRDMSDMFSGATVFNSDISKWDVSRVSNMDCMFRHALMFKRNLCGPAWVRSRASKTLMFAGSPGSISRTTCTATQACSPRSKKELKRAVAAHLTLSPEDDVPDGPHGPIALGCVTLIIIFNLTLILAHARTLALVLAPTYTLTLTIGYETKQQRRVGVGMVSPDALGLVREYRLKANLPVPDTPAIPNAARCRAFMDKLDAELRGFRRSIDTQNVRNVGISLSALQHVLSGAVLECGMGSLFKSLFDEVHRSNMSKACATAAEAEATCSNYRSEKDTACIVKPVGDKFVVYREGDDKVLKSVKYSKVNFLPLLGQYVGNENMKQSMVSAKAPATAASAYGVPDCLNDMKAFHELFRVPVLSAPTIPDPKRCDLRVTLMAEEVRELEDAIDASDLVEVADALCDIQAVLAGTVLEFGLGSGFRDMFAQLHAARLAELE